MKRSIRRHQQRVAKLRHMQILVACGAWTPWRDSGDWLWRPKAWRQINRFAMKEPGWWVHEKVIRPARLETRRNEHGIERGLDPDAVLWPDCKRPHEYYW
jgi:hypothetical protein